jgi:hypothetical protein
MNEPPALGSGDRDPINLDREGEQSAAASRLEIVTCKGPARRR